MLFAIKIFYQMECLKDGFFLGNCYIRTLGELVHQIIWCKIVETFIGHYCVAVQ